jgi:thiamine biosynthesis lipoprotein
MTRNETIEKLLRASDRRAFLKIAGLAGVAALAGGGLRATLKVLDDGVPVVARERTAMGTFVEIQAVHESRDRCAEAIETAFAEMDRLVAILNRHDDASPLSHLNAGGLLADPPSELTDVLLHALDVHRRTGGAFDPTVKPLIDLLESGRPSDEELREAAGLVGAEGVRFADRRIELERDGAGVTLDGVAKGYIVDRMSAALSRTGVINHLVNAGGDIRTRGERAPARAWTIAIEDPKKRGDYPDVIRMRDGAVATSGSYENYYDGARWRHHIVDPSTGLSPHECASASVRARSAMEADALSTAVMLTPERAETWAASARGALGYLVVRNDGGVHSSPGWKATSRG